MMNYGSFWQFLHGILEFCSGYSAPKFFIILRLPFLWWSSCMTSAWSKIRTALYGVRIPGSIMISFCFMFIKLDYQSKEQRFSLHLGYWFYFCSLFFILSVLSHTLKPFLIRTTFGSFWPLLVYIIRGDWVFLYLVWFWFWLVVLILVHPAPHLIWLFGLHLVPFFGGLAVWRTLLCVWLECGLFLFVATPTRWQHRFMVTWHLMFPIVHRATVPKSGTFAHTSGFVLVLLLFYLVLKWVDKK